MLYFHKFIISLSPVNLHRPGLGHSISTLFYIIKQSQIKQNVCEQIETIRQQHPLAFVKAKLRLAMRTMIQLYMKCNPREHNVYQMLPCKCVINVEFVYLTLLPAVKMSYSCYKKY